MSDLQQLLQQLMQTNVTKTVQRELYPAILPSRPELSQAGKVVLITGGGTGVGYAIARSFVQASADTVIIIGRRVEVLASAGSLLEQEAKTAGTNTKIVTRPCDVVNLGQVDELWKDLATQGITVDVFVANAAKFTEPKPILELGADEVWSQFEVNAKSPLYFTEKFYSQPGDKQKFLINVSTASVHMTAHPGVAMRPAYTLTKMTGTLLFQLIAQSMPPQKMQVISFRYIATGRRQCHRVSVRNSSTMLSFVVGLQSGLPRRRPNFFTDTLHWRRGTSRNYRLARFESVSMRIPTSLELQSWG